jgi:hypothetical protein
MTTPRVTVFEASFRTDCVSVQIATTFDNKKNLRALKSESDLDHVLSTNLKILEMGKLLESNSKINTLCQPRGDGSGVRACTRDGTVARGGGVRGGALSTRTDPEQSCLWCAKKGHSIFDCPSPSTPDLKKVRDDLVSDGLPRLIHTREHPTVITIALPRKERLGWRTPCPPFRWKSIAFSSHMLLLYPPEQVLLEGHIFPTQRVQYLDPLLVIVKYCYHPVVVIQVAWKNYFIDVKNINLVRPFLHSDMAESTLLH